MPIVTNSKSAKQHIRTVSQQKIQQATHIVHASVLDTLSGNRSGQVYDHPSNNTTYKASAPGEPPASPTGELIQSIQSTVVSTNTSDIGTVGSTSDIAPILENGALNMAPRPFIGPSFDRATPQLRQILGGD